MDMGAASPLLLKSCFVEQAFAKLTKKGIEIKYKSIMKVSARF